MRFKDRKVAGYLSLVPVFWFLLMWGTYLFYGNCECTSIWEAAYDGLAMALDSKYEASLFFRASLFSMAACFIYGATLLAKDLNKAPLAAILALVVLHSMVGYYIYNLSTVLMLALPAIALGSAVKNA